MDYKYYFWGLFFDCDDEQMIKENSKIGIQGAIINFQYSMLDGLIDNGVDLLIINTPCIGNFPRKYRKIYVKNKVWSYKNKNCSQIGFVNLPLFKQLQRRKKFYKTTKENIDSEKENIIIIYSLYLPFLRSAYKLKKKFPNVKIVLIVPDLPSIYGVLPKNVVKRFIYKKYGDIMLKNVKEINFYVLLTDYMKEPLKIDKNYCVIDGISNSTIIQKNDISKNILLYTGTIDKVFGIAKLIEVMSYLPEDYELWICGKGDFESELLKIQCKDKRIKYFGYLTHKEILEKQRQAKLLVNPRENVGEYIKYSFPSKTFEYLASGTPLIMHKLDCMGDEYDDYIYYFSSSNAQNMAKNIIDICTKSDKDLLNVGKKAQKFVKEYKNCFKQTQKIIHLVEKNYD